MDYHDFYERHRICVWTVRKSSGLFWAYTIDDGPMVERAAAAAHASESMVLEEGIEECRRHIKRWPGDAEAA